MRNKFVTANYRPLPVAMGKRAWKLHVHWSTFDYKWNTIIKKNEKMEPGNYYEDKGKRQFVHQTKKNAAQKAGQAENTSEKWKDTAKGVGTDLVIGVLGGGLIAAAIGKPALMVGLAISGYGHYAQNKMISALGLGIMASGTMSALNSKSVPPTLNERVRAFGEELKRKLFLDKLLTSKAENLSGPKPTGIKQTYQTPKASDFVQYQERQKENQAENPTKVNATKKMQQESNTDDFDFNEKIY